MAGSEARYLEDIDEKFCQCPICLQQYREPKQLPCLHRYCRDCLHELIERYQEIAVANCPECRDEFTIPQEGVDGFKTDFYMNNIIEYIQIQKSLKNEQLRECYNCSKKLNVSAYCFKCNGFLCQECHKVHMTSRSLNDHKKHTLSLDDLETKQMTLEKLSDLREAPRCESHPEDVCRLCCKSCDNVPICVTCTYGDHENHQVKDVKILANEERGKLKNQLTTIGQHRNRLSTISKVLEESEKDLLSNVQEKKENIQTIYERNVQSVKQGMKKMEDEIKIGQTEIENRKRKKLEAMRKQMDEEMKQLKEKYDTMCNEVEFEVQEELDNLKQKHHTELQQRRDKLQKLERHYQTFTETIEKKQKEGLTKLLEIAQQVKGVKERYENLTTTGYSIIEAMNDWTAVQCIPDICKAIGPLSEDMKKEFPELDVLSKIGMIPEIIEDEESPVTIERFETNEWEITGFTGCNDSSIVMSGCTSRPKESHVTVINVKGNVLRQKKLISFSSLLPVRYCAVLSEFKVATASQANDIGVYDIRDGSCTVTRSIKDSKNRVVMCVTTDTNNNYILVGKHESRDVYIFDDRLNYHYTLALPEIIRYPFHMVMSDGNLLVCDLRGKRAFVVSIEGRKGKLIREFMKPNYDRDNWGPLSVCTDRNGLIYMLWEKAEEHIITQYTYDGSLLLTQKQINIRSARCVTTVKADNTEKLLVASLNSGKFHVYSLT